MRFHNKKSLVGTFRQALKLELRCWSAWKRIYVDIACIAETGEGDNFDELTRCVLTCGMQSAGSNSWDTLLVGSQSA